MLPGPAFPSGAAVHSTSIVFVNENDTIDFESATSNSIHDLSINPNTQCTQAKSSEQVVANPTSQHPPEPSAATGIHGLPIELLRSILFYVATHEQRGDVRSFSHVCSTWHSLSLEHRFGRVVINSGDGKATYEARWTRLRRMDRFFRRSPECGAAVREVRVCMDVLKEDNSEKARNVVERETKTPSRPLAIRNWIAQILARMPALRTLHLDFNSCPLYDSKITRGLWQDLESFFATLRRQSIGRTTLHSLHLTNSALQSCPIGTLPLWIATLDSLETLTASHLHTILLTDFLAIETPAPHIRTLALTHLRDTRPPTLLPNPSWHTLTTLDLTSCSVLLSDPDLLPAVASFCPELERLLIPLSPPTNGPLTAFHFYPRNLTTGLAAVAMRCKLRELDLSYHGKLGDVTVEHVLATTPGLEVLLLVGCKNLRGWWIRREGPACSGLRVLDVSGCKGLVEGWEGKMMEWCRELVVLNRE